MFEPLQPLPGLAAAEEWAIIFAFVFMLFDFITGIVGALVRHAFESSKVREGLGHKAMIVMVIILAIAVQLASGVIGNLGFDIPLISPVCVIIIVMEIGSILETVGQTYPDLSDSGIFKLFHKEADNDSD